MLDYDRADSCFRRVIERTTDADTGFARSARASALRGVQWLYERITIPLAGEHFRRRPVVYLAELGFLIEESERFSLGVVERVCARKPG